MLPNIEDLTQFLYTGTIKSNKFEVLIEGKGFNKNFTAIRVNVPSIGLEYSEMNASDRFVFAPKELTSQQIEITFIDNAKREVYNFFVERIFDACYNFEIPRLRKFHDEIKIDTIRIWNLDRWNNRQICNVFEDCIVTNISDLNFAANEEGRSIFVSVTFKFAFQRVEK